MLLVYTADENPSGHICWSLFANPCYSRAHLHVDFELEGKLYLRDMLVGENSIPKEKHILFIHISKIHHIFKYLICSVGSYLEYQNLDPSCV